MPAKYLHIKGAREHNLKDVELKIPRDSFVVFTGLSGSGKSSLVNEVIYKHLAYKLNRSKAIPGKHKAIEGIENLDKVIDIDQSPIGRTPRSNPATYTGVFNDIRELFSMTPEAKSAFTGFLTRELDRYLAMENPGRDELENLELMADVCGHLPGEQTQRQLHALLERKEAHIGYFAAVSLLKNDMILPQEAVEFLARDLGYALLTHALLKKHGQASRFPAECATEEYLAKSDLVHWLLYPTELGQAPDEIEYIGKFKPFLKKNAYHIFRFRSNSDTLSEDCKGKWLIGWSNCDSGTFSNFDLYDDYAKDTPEATVKNIRKKLIG